MGLQISTNPIMVKASRASVRRFIKDYLAIGETEYWFHQTLTFKDGKTDEKTAKGHLCALLDSLGKAFPDMPALFVQERQKRQGLHYHVIFLLFGAQRLSPAETRMMLDGEIFPRWRKITGGKVVRDANQLKLREKSLYGLWYLLKGVEPTEGRLARQPHWHGIRKGKIISTSSKPVTKQEVRRAWNFIFAGRKAVNPEPATRPTEKHFVMPDIQVMKAYAEWTGSAIDWEAFKRNETGRSGKVSDNVLIAFYRQQGQPENPLQSSDADTL